jgi:alpha-N-arabinofuranosidase
VEAGDGSWWAVALAMRTRWADDGYHYPMGRETFLAEVVWEDGWPVLNPGIGALRTAQTGLGGALRSAAVPERDDFDRDTLGPGWSFVRTPRVPIADLSSRPGWLGLIPQPSSIEDDECPGFVCRPQDAWAFTASGLLDFTPRTEGDVAGIVLRQNENYALQLLIGLPIDADPDGRRTARAIRRFAGVDEVVAELPIGDGAVLLSVTGADLEYQFAVDGTVVATLDGRGLSTSVAGGFTGTMLGPYGHGTSIGYWDWFEYRPC